MTSDYEEWAESYLIHEAATYVLGWKMGRDEAIKFVYELREKREQAVCTDEVIRDEDGSVDSYIDSELNLASTHGINSDQLVAVHMQLCEVVGIPYVPIVSI